ncbi:DeoR family transcriptional regulator [Sphingomonas sp. Leaf34]|uniref:DeoR/GlpR family DNA-binding transcription regulator n=1 Tax=Sphingomonas sp. Leaf34 TaxID=1736216 RepID=UPI0006FDA99F|nr:DeoR/GlpR family DNA-binding transcription regulator [Sphingomonas sp. Leaf34]KQN30337.1 DeoR family transcriptional regulator [Sphingomonas sp. Leaf34]
MMKRSDRRQDILDLLRNGDAHAIAEMATALAVSDETIRRELRQMEADGSIERIHGGARLAKTAEEGAFEVRLGRNAAAKQRIATAVSLLVDDGQSLYIDASSTSHYAARALRSKRDLTIVTNALGVVQELGGRNGNRVYAAGGELDDRYRAYFDSDARAYLSRFRPRLAIISTESVDPVAGFTNYHVGEAALCRQMIAQSERVLIAVDASKFDRCSVAAVATFTEVDILVADRAPGEAYAAAMETLEWVIC